MDLRELLLQFAGENGETLRLDELLSSSVIGIEVVEDLDGAVRLLVENPKMLEEIKDRIVEVLDKNGYEKYTITPMKNGPDWSILVNAEK
jgi:hypothetical protein